MAHKLWAKRVLVKALPSYLFSWPFSSSFNCPKALSKVSLTELNEILSSVFELIFEKKKKSKRREKVKGNYFYLILNSGEFLQELIWSDHKLFSSCRTDQSKITKSCRWQSWKTHWNVILKNSRFDMILTNFWTVQSYAEASVDTKR